MVPTSLIEETAGLSTGDRQTLLEVAQRAIERGLAGDRLKVRPEEFSACLQAQAASFVTIKVRQQLRGCIGTLEAQRALIADVVSNAYSAAFRDPRFPALTRAEFLLLDIHISVLSEPQPMAVESEADLLAQLRPGIDGLVLEEGYHRGTFLPAVWEHFSEPREFVQHLKRKAGLPADYWSPALRVSRYTTESFP
jgi:AmmeMemoRadiSam system protein A